MATAAFACAHPVLHADWSQYHGPGAAAFAREQLTPPREPDPLEPVNRGVSIANHGLVLGVATPLGYAYRFLVPRIVRQHVANFASNLTAPRRIAANLLQGKFSGARDETVRLLLNTTVGIAGFFDPADRFGFRVTDEDFGQVFGYWGWRPSTYLMLPLFGPSTTRDGVGLVPDALLDPATYFFPAGPILTWNELSDQVEPYHRFVESTFDPYDDVQLIWRVMREEQIVGVELGTGQDTAAVQTLQAAFLAPRDPRFVETLSEQSVKIPTTGRMLPYTYRLQPGRAPLVFLLPGLGGHRLSRGSLALAEMAWQRGFSVVVISNALNFEFMQRASTVAVPGFAPVDAHDVHVALDAIDRDLALRARDRVSARVLMGYSLGAFHTFYIAASDDRDLVRFDRFVTLDSPVSLLHGLDKLDDFYNAPMALPAATRYAEVRHILLKAAAVASSAVAGPLSYSRLDTADVVGNELEPDVEVPFTNMEAEFLIGFAFRRTLQEILWVSQSRQDLGVLRTPRSSWRRAPAYIEMGEYSYAQYFYGFVLPYYQGRDPAGIHPDLSGIGSPTWTADEMIAHCDLRSLEGALRRLRNVYHFANSNDFLTTEADEKWLADVLGADRVRFFPRGGHLGNLNRPAVQDAIMDTLQDLVPPAHP